MPNDKAPTKTKDKEASLPSPFKRVLPESLKVERDELKIRLDFYEEAIVMQDFSNKGGSFRIVNPDDIAHALSKEIQFGSGLLPENTLWWTTDGKQATVAIWMPPGIRKLALSSYEAEVGSPPERYDVPLPGLIFICRPGLPPAVFAASKRPSGIKERVYKAPMSNIYPDGNSCPGNNRYPADIAEIPESFLRSFFTQGANIGNRSKKYPKNITDMWKELSGLKATEYPLADLQYHSTVGDIMAWRWGS